MANIAVKRIDRPIQIVSAGARLKADPAYLTFLDGQVFGVFQPNAEVVDPDDDGEVVAILRAWALERLEGYGWS